MILQWNHSSTCLTLVTVPAQLESATQLLSCRDRAMVEGSGTRRERPDRTEPDQEARECFRMIILSRDRDEASVRFRIEEGTGRRVELPDRTEFDREARECFNRMISTLSQDGVLPQDRDEAHARFGREMRVRPTLLHNAQPLRRLTARQRIHAFISVVLASPWRFASHTSLYTRAFYILSGKRSGH